MLETKILSWLQVISYWYILLPLVLVIFRWKTHDTIRRRIAFYVIFNVCFTAVTTLLDELKINNMVVYYLGSPLFLWVVYRIFEPLIGIYPFWKIIKYLVISFVVFVAVDMIWIENYKDFPNNIYPAQEVIILLMIYYFLYIFSKEARQDFSSLWANIGIGISALIILIILIYNPYLGFKPNTFGHFIWAGLGSFATILTYSFVTYGLYIARPNLEN